MKHSFRAAAAVGSASIAAALVLSACTSAGQSSSSSSSAGKSLTLALSADLAGWSPAKMLGVGPAAWASQGVYDSLFNCDAKGAPQPNIAQSYEFTDGNTKLTLHLRPGMKFTDETPVDSTAVKANIEFQEKQNLGAGDIAGATVTTPDAMTAVVTFPSPQPVVLTDFCGVAGIVASPKYLASGNLDEAPVGSGPYTLDKADSTPGSVYILKKNPDNWNSQSFPYQQITLKVIADPTATLNALKSGQIAGADTVAATANQVKAAGLDQITFNGTWAGLIIGDRAGKLVPALGNADVRRAINMVFDKQSLVKNLFQGQAEPTAQIFRKGSDAYVENLTDPYPYDVSKAKDLMAKAGYADGFSVDIPFVAGFGFDQAMPVVIQQLSLLNIKANQVTLSGPNAIPDVISGKYPIVYWPLGNHGNSLEDITAVAGPKGVWNFEHSADPTVSGLLTKIQTDDPTASAADQKSLNRYFVDQAWFTPMVYPQAYFSFDSKKVTVKESTDPNALAPNLRDFQ